MDNQNQGNCGGVTEQPIVELSDIDLALIGGGIGDTAV